MPVTANFALPYPGALDEPCDFAQDWCAFTDATSTVLAGLQAVAIAIICDHQGHGARNEPP